jgi:sulfur-carrier protein
MICDLCFSATLIASQKSQIANFPLNRTLFGGICRHMKILIPTPLRQYAGKKDIVDVPAQTVGEALSGLTTQYSDLRRHLYTDDGKLRAFVNVYLNDEDIRYLQKESTPVRDGDTLSIVPSIAGGCCPASGGCPR